MPRVLLQWTHGRSTACRAAVDLPVPLVDKLANAKTYRAGKVVEFATHAITSALLASLLRIKIEPIRYVMTARGQ